MISGKALRSSSANRDNSQWTTQLTEKVPQICPAQNPVPSTVSLGPPGAEKGLGVSLLMGLLPSKQPKVRMLQPTSGAFYTMKHKESVCLWEAQSLMERWRGGQWEPWPREPQDPALASLHPERKLGSEPKDQ